MPSSMFLELRRAAEEPEVCDRSWLRALRMAEGSIRISIFQNASSEKELARQGAGYKDHLNSALASSSAEKKLKERHNWS